MTFDDMLAQITDLLKRQGRVSYPALKAEIMEAQQLATDENGRVF